MNGLLLVIVLITLIASGTSYVRTMCNNKRTTLRLRMASDGKEEKVKAEVLGKPELVDALREKTGLMKKDVEALLEAFTDTVNEKVLVEGKELRIRDLGNYRNTNCSNNNTNNFRNI